MKKFTLMTSAAVVLSALMTLPAAAAGVTDNLEVYGTAGLNGVGVGVGYGLNEKFSVRSDISAIGFSRKFNEDDVRYKAKLKNQKINVYGDYFPAANGFRLTAGLGLGKTELSATGHARYMGSHTFTIGNQKYNVTLDGEDTVKATVKYPKVAPYLGIGWGHNISQKASGSWGFTADLGLSLGAPKTKLSVNSSLNQKLVDAQAALNKASVSVSDAQKAAAQAEVDSRIAAEQKKIKDRVGKYKVVPSLSVGVSYRF